MDEKMENSEKEESGIDRRKAPRVKGVVVEYSFEDTNPYRKSAFMKDMSILGVCIFIPEKLEMGKEFFLKIYLSGSQIPLKTKGRIVWQRRSDYLGYYNSGIEFLEINTIDEKRLYEYILYFLNKPPQDEE